MAMNLERAGEGDAIVDAVFQGVAHLEGAGRDRPRRGLSGYARYPMFRDRHPRGAPPKIDHFDLTEYTLLRKNRADFQKSCETIFGTA